MHRYVKFYREFLMSSVYQTFIRARTKLTHASVKISAFISTRSFTYELNYLWTCIFIRDTSRLVLPVQILIQGVHILTKNISKYHDQIWNIASKTKITIVGMIYQSWFTIIEILSKWCQNFAGLIPGLKESSRNKPRFF